MTETDLVGLLQPNKTIKQGQLYIAKGIAERTVWDKHALDNPTHAVISAKDETTAKEKSLKQIAEIKQYLKPEDVLLDFGTGYGRVAQYLLPHMKLTGYIGMDSSSEMLTLFRQRYIRCDLEQKTPLLLLNADIHTVPLKDASVDVAIVCAVFLHNHKDVVEKSLNELTRVVKRGGTVLVYSSFPRVATFMGLQGMAYQIFLNLMGTPFKNGPVRYYTKKEVMKLFKNFTELDIVPSAFTLAPKTLIFLPGPLEKIYRVGFANPVNKLLEKIVPLSLKPYFAVHYDVVAKR